MSMFSGISSSALGKPTTKSLEPGWQKVMRQELMRTAQPKALERLYVPGTAGVQVPLSALAKVLEKPALLGIMHAGQYPAVTLTFDPAPNASLGDAVKAIEQAWQRVRAQGLPATISSQSSGR